MNEESQERGRVWLLVTEMAGVTAHTGGVGRRYAAFASELARLGHQVIVHVYPAFTLLPPSQRRLDQAVTYRIHRPWGLNKRWRPVASSLRAAFVLAGVRKEVVICPEWEGLAALSPKWARSRLVTNLVTGLEASKRIEEQPLSNGVPLHERIQIWLERTQFKHSARVVACSGAMRELTRHIWNSDMPIDVINNAVSVTSIKNLASQGLSHGMRGPSPSIVFAGRLEVRKGIVTFCDAMVTLLGRHPDLTVSYCGRDSTIDGEKSSNYIARILEPWSTRVSILGDLSQRELIRQFQLATVTVTPSLWEAFGNIGLEVMAAGGSPLVATSGSGFNDYCLDGKNSLLVAPGDADALAGAISRLLEDASLRESLIATAYIDVDRFEMSNIAREWSQSIEDLTKA